MEYTAGQPKRGANGVLEWRGRWSGFPYLALGVLPLVRVGMYEDGAPWVALLGFALVLAAYFWGPRRVVELDPERKEIRVRDIGYGRKGISAVFPFAAIREVIVSDLPSKPRTIELVHADGVLSVLTLSRVWANEQAIGELKALVAASSSGKAS